MVRIESRHSYASAHGLDLVYWESTTWNFKEHENEYLGMKSYMTVILLLAVIFEGCQNGQISTASRPNILWIYLEDTSPLLGCYDSPLAKTQNIDYLAQKGTLFTCVYMPAPVCSPCRSTIITGVMSTTLGAHNHHSSRTPESAIILPEEIETIPEIFKKNGYYTFNNGKDDYNFSYDRRVLYDQDYDMHPLYGKRGHHIPLSSLPAKSPFFGQIQLSGGKEIFSATFKDKVSIPVDRSKIHLPPYLPDHLEIIEEYANHIDAINLTDEKVGKIIAELRQNNLLENTIIFFFSDHGMRLTRHKQFLYDGGLHVPLIIADFRKNRQIKAGIIDDQLVSGIDLGPTALYLAGLEIPKYMEGRAIYDSNRNRREYVISTRDRCDFTIDRIRSVRSKEYKYIRNFMLDRTAVQPTYMDVDSVKFVHTMKQLYADGKLDSVQQIFFSDDRPVEELYDLKMDPFELRNLAEDPVFTETREKYAAILDQWIEDTNDQGQYPENEDGLKFMLGIWGRHAVNPEYTPLRKAYPDLEGSFIALKNANWRQAEE